MKRRVKIPYVICIGYANGCAGDIPPPQERERGGYEAIDAHKLSGLPAAFHPDSLDRILPALPTLIGRSRLR